MPATTLVKEVPAKQRVIPTLTTLDKQQLLAKEVFGPQKTSFKRERIIPLHKEEALSADLINKSSLSKYNNNYE